MICWFPVLPFSLWNVDTWLISASVKSPWPLGLRSHGPRALLRHLRAKVWGRGGETGEAWGLNLHYLSLLAGGHGCTIPRFLVSTAGCLSQENVKGITLWASRVTTWISGEPRTGPLISFLGLLSSVQTWDWNAGGWNSPHEEWKPQEAEIRLFSEGFESVLSIDSNWPQQQKIPFSITYNSPITH